MKLYLMRHGESPGMLDANVQRDCDRPLSDKGRQDTRKSAARINKEGDVPELLLVSPLLRARQTAEEMAQILKPSPKVVPYEPLANKIPGSEILEALEKDGHLEKNLLIVGHLPQIPELAYHMTGDSCSFPPSGVFAFRAKGESARLLWSFTSFGD